MRHPIRIGTLVKGEADPAGVIRQLVGHGFESFQITFWKTLGQTDLRELAPRVQEALGDTGAVVSSLGIYGNPLDEGEAGAVCRQSWEACMEHAALFGTSIIGGFTGRLSGLPIPDSLPRFASVFGELAQRAEAGGLKVAFENCQMGGSWASGAWNIAHNPAAWQRMFNAVPSEALGLEWEPCHQMLQLIEPLPQLRQWLPKIFHVHGKDASLYRDVIAQHGVTSEVPFGHHRTPGFGDTNWTDVISALRLGGYQGSIDIEGWHDPVYQGYWELTGQLHALAYLKQYRGGTWVPYPDP